MKLAEATKSPTIMAANKELFDMLGSGTVKQSLIS